MFQNYYSKKSFLFIFYILFVSVSTTALGQISSYTFATAAGTSLEDMSSGTTQIIADGVDDGSSAVTNIGFSFFYNCTSYTQFSVNSNGLMRMGGTVVSTEYSNSLANGSDDAKITAYWDDNSTGSAASGSKVHYKVFGAAPNRRLVVEWLVHVPYNTTAAYNATYQVVLYESNYSVKFIYGTVPAGSNYSVGLAASSIDYISVSTASNTASTTVTNDTQSGAISSGRSYTFSPASAPGTMTYTSSNTLTASIENVTKCSTSQAIIALKVVATGCASPISLTQLQINMTGSTSPLADVSKIHIYYTGASNKYIGTSPFDGTGTNPAAGTITINGSQTLIGGNNFFWIVYDINPSSTSTNVVDAQCTQITVDGVTHSPTTTAPSGNRAIVDCPATLANYALTSNMIDATGNYGNAGKSGTASGPTASGVCNDGTWTATDTYTPNLGALNPDNFEIEVEVSLNSFNHPIIIGGNSFRWIGLYTTAGGYLSILYNNNNTIVTTTALTLSTYYKLKLIYTSGLLQLYVNTVLVYENAAMPNPLTHGSDFDFYTTNYSNGTVLDGCIRNLSFTNNPNALATSVSLPIDLLSFEIKCDATIPEITWITASEKNNDFFTLERSFDGFNFVKVTQTDGAGNSVKTIHYSFKDPIRHLGRIFYYRLSQTDYDGKKQTFDAVSTICTDENNTLTIVTIDPSSNNLKLMFYSPDKGEHTVQIHDLLGKLVATTTVQVSEEFNTVSLDFLPQQSLYLLSIQNLNEKVSLKLFL